MDFSTSTDSYAYIRKNYYPYLKVKFPKRDPAPKQIIYRKPIDELIHKGYVE